MNSLSRIGVAFSLIAVLAFWTGCDSTGPSDEDTTRPTVEFSSGGAGGVPIDGTIDVGVTLTDSVGAPVSVEVLFATQASSATPADVGGFSGDPPTKSISFPDTAPAGATQSFAVDISNADISAGSKEALFALQQLDAEGAVEIGEPREFGLSIGAKPIAEARTEAREALVNDNQATVTVRGTVTRAFGVFARFQDDSGPTGASGLVIRQADGNLADQFQQEITDGTIQPGTELLVTGSVSQFSGLLQINGEDLDSYQIVSQGDPPAPQTVSLSDLEGPNGENYESELVRVEGLSFPNASGSFAEDTGYTLQTEGGTTVENIFRVQGPDETNVIGGSIPGGAFNYEGIVGQFNVFSGVDADEGYQLIPVRSSDIQTE